MKTSILFSIVVFGLFVSASAQKTEIVFDVLFKGNKIGILKATEEKIGNRYLRDLKSNTDAKVMIMSIHVESEVSTTHENGTLVKGAAYRHANRGAEDIHALTTKVGDKKYKCEMNGGASEIDNREISFCVIDLYFKEPKGLSEIYATMHTSFVRIKPVAPGKYALTSPEGKDSYFMYSEGKLMSVELDTPLGTVITKRN